MNDDPFHNPRHLDENGKMIYELLPEEVVRFRSIMADAYDILCDECHEIGVGAVVSLVPVVDDEERAHGPRRPDMDVCQACADKLLATGKWEEA